MKRYITNWRFWVLFAFFAISVVLLIAEPTATDMRTWWLTFVASKVMAGAVAIAACVLYRYWAKRGQLKGLFDLMMEE